MWRFSSLVGLVAVASIWSQPTFAARVMIYGVGLESCEAFSAARSDDGSAGIVFNDWVAGYLSGANATPNHGRNNLLGFEDLRAALYRLSDICQQRPKSSLASAAGLLLMGMTSHEDVHSVESATYGSGLRSCQQFTEARANSAFDRQGFVDWLGGYFSAINSLSIKTDNVLGSWQIKDAVQWLDGYCGTDATATMASAVTVLLADRTNSAAVAVASAPGR